MADPQDLGEVRELVRKAPKIKAGDLVYLLGVSPEHEIGYVLIHVDKVSTLDFDGTILGDMHNLKPGTSNYRARPARWAVIQTTGVN